MKLDSVPVAGTFSKDKIFFSKLPFEYIVEMDGALIKGNDNQWYVDWVCGLGANILGQGPGKRDNGFNEYVAMHARKGVAGSLPYRLEYQVAEKLTNMLSKYVPSWAGAPLQVRWVLSGSDACNAAIRLARAVTNKNYVASIGYHGWADTFISATPPAHGIPSLAHNPLINAYEFGSLDIDSLDTSCVIIEQPSVNPPDEYYVKLRRWCNEHRALLIVDEVVTGLRYGLGGVCERYGVHPDLICMGKALGNGYPIAALVGPREYMDWFNPSLRPNGDPVFVSSTNVGCTAGLAAADYMLSNWKQKDVDYLWDTGNQLMDALRELHLPIIGHGPRSLVNFENDYARAYFMREMTQRGIIMNRPNFVCRAHTARDVRVTIQAAREVVNEMRKEPIIDGMYPTYGIPENELPLRMFRNR